MKLIALAISEFALPVPRVGSIETNSGYGHSAADGQEIHLAVQARRAEADSSYQSEVRIEQSISRGPYQFKVAGRMDGLFDGEIKRIEEIKSSFNIRDLARKLKDSPDTHPYCLQLRTYGYFYWLKNQVMPALSFHLVSTRNRESVDVDLSLDLPQYEGWLGLRLAELEEEAKKAEKRADRRRKIAEEFPFPFEKPRSGQVELIQAIQDGMKEDKRMLVQAPTGLGKTAGVLYPALKEALGRAQRVIYVTPKNSQHSVAEDAVQRFQDTGSKVKSLTITAKSKICFKNEPLCNPQYCEYAKDHYTKVHAAGLPELLAKKKKLTAKTFRKLGEEHQVCPFELQLDAAVEADTVICDYNYVFAPRSAFGRIAACSLGQEGKPNLVIDEAHNLPSRTMDYYSPALSTYTLEKMRLEARDLPKRFRGEAEELLDSCIQVLINCRPKGDAGGKASRIEPPAEPFLEQDGKLRAFLSRYLDSDVDIQPRDVVLRLSFYWSEFTGALEYVSDPEHTEFFTTFQPHPSGGIVKITCCDASRMLEACYDDYSQVVGFSATLKPFEYYAKLSGLESENLRTEEFLSPFPKSNRKLLIIPQVSTKYSDRERNYSKIADAIQRITRLHQGNYFVFVPSFEFLGRLLDVFDVPEGFQALRQERDMRAADLEQVLDRLREPAAMPLIVFAVQGGIFSEGVDYPGRMIIGAFVVGPPLPNFDLEREQMRAYYDENYGSGFDYAYTYPAMAKAVQAAGRVIRSETDRGLIVLMDSRFVQPSYFKSMPKDWFQATARELVSDRILSEISDFWSDQSTTEGLFEVVDDRVGFIEPAK